MPYIGTQANGAGNFTLKLFSGDNSTTAFTLDVTPASVYAVFIAISGVIQTPGVDFTLSGTTITFTTAPATGTSNIVTWVSGVLPIAVPADGSVSIGKLSPSSASAANKKLAVDSAGTSLEYRTMAPTIQKFTSGSGTYTTPSGCVGIIVELAGGGGGAAGSGNAGTAGAGTAGNNTTFGSLTASGGSAGSSTTGGAGGGASGGDVNLPGGDGGSAYVNGGAAGGYISGANGGNSFFGGGGRGGTAGAGDGQAGKTNTGGGGGGGSYNDNTYGWSGPGGGAGGYCRKVIASPSATYSYSVGASAAGGSAGTNGNVGGAGAAGIIIVTEYY